MNSKILLLKIEKFSDFLRWGSRLFHSVMFDGKKEFLKKLCFVLTGEILCIFRVEYNKRLVGIKLNKCLFHFPRPYTKGKAFYTSVDLEVLQSQFLIDFFLLTYPLLLLLRLKYWIDHNFSLNEILKVWS